MSRSYRELKESERFLLSLLSKQNTKLEELRQKAASDYEHLSGTISYLRNANREMGQEVGYYAERYHELLLKTGEVGSCRSLAPAKPGSAGASRYAN